VHNPNNPPPLPPHPRAHNIPLRRPPRLNGLQKFAPGASWEIMYSSCLFTLNLAFGAMTFTQVKVIDVAWNLVIGRGGQVELVWVDDCVFNAW
jgi:hypothetical protein